MEFQYRPIAQKGDFWTFSVGMPDGTTSGYVKPGGKNVFIRRDLESDHSEGSAKFRQALVGTFGLAPWATLEGEKPKYFVTARTDTVAENKMIADLWHRGQHCIIPMHYFLRTRSGKLYPERVAISSETNEPLGVAGLWSEWQHRNGHMAYSYVMLTTSGEQNSTMRWCRYQDYELRMPLILSLDKQEKWLDVSPAKSLDFIEACPVVPLRTHKPSEVPPIKQPGEVVRRRKKSTSAGGFSRVRPTGFLAARD